MSVEHVMERVGRLAASDQLLDVQVRGVQAYAEPGRVVLPAIERFEWLGPDAEDMLYGILAHECGHASFTDFSVREQTKATDRRWCPAFKTLWNVIEDAFVEREKGREFRGCAISLKRLHEWMWARGLDGCNGTKDLVATGCHPITGLPAQPFSLLIALLQATLSPFGGKSLAELRAVSARVDLYLDGLYDEIERARHCTSTAECFEVARAIYDKIEEMAEGYEKPDPKPGPGETKAGETEAQEAEEGEAEEVVGNPLAEMVLERYTPEPDLPLNPSEAFEVRCTKIFEQPDAGSLAPYVVFSHDFDLVRDFSKDDNAHYGAGWDLACEDARAAGEALTSAFEVALRAQAETRAVSGYDYGEPDPELIGHYAVGACQADRLFMQYEHGEGDDVAVAVLLDCSGSMRGVKAELARQAAIAIHQALAPCQINHEITGFTTVFSGDRLAGWGEDAEFAAHTRQNFDALRQALAEAAARGTNLGVFARSMFYGASWQGTLQVPVYGIFKSFEQSDARGLMQVRGLNQNLDGEAVLWQAQRLAARPERRRVMFVLSDGLPSGCRDNAQGVAYLKEAVARTIASGIEVYGLGIRSEHVCHFYPEWWLCQNLEDLTALAVGALTEVLLRNRQERAWVEVA